MCDKSSWAASTLEEVDHLSAQVLRVSLSSLWPDEVEAGHREEKEKAQRDSDTRDKWAGLLSETQCQFYIGCLRNLWMAIIYH